MRLTSALNLALAFLLWLAFVLGCANSSRPPKPTGGPLIKGEGSGKIVVSYDEQLDKHYYRLDDFKFYPDEPKLPAGDDFELNFQAEATGKTYPQTITVTMYHNTASKTRRMFSRDSTLSLSVDGAQLQTWKCIDDTEKVLLGTPRCYEIDLKKDDPHDAQFYETFIFELSPEHLQKIAQAKNVSLKVGPQTVVLTPAAVTAIKEFEGALK